MLKLFMHYLMLTLDVRVILSLKALLAFILPVNYLQGMNQFLYSVPYVKVKLWYLRFRIDDRYMRACSLKLIKKNCSMSYTKADPCTPLLENIDLISLSNISVPTDLYQKMRSCVLIFSNQLIL